jgi:hypothetical protein
MKNIPTALSLLAIFTSQVLAELSFEKTTIEHTALPGEAAYTAEFVFKNTGDTEIEIMKPTSSCGCTVPTLEKSTYAPGEEGKITAVFTYGVRSGVNNKTINVPTSEGAHQLLLTVDIPQRYKVSRQLVRWTSGEELTTEDVVFDFLTNVPVEVKEVRINREIFDLEMTMSDDRSQVTATFTPLVNETTSTQRVEFDFVDSEGLLISIPIYMRVY